MLSALVLWAAASAAAAEDPADVARRLASPMCADFVSVSVNEFVDDLRVLTGLTILIDLPELEKEGIDAARPAITVKLMDVSVRSVLHVVLESQQLGYYPRYDGALIVTSARQLERRYVLQSFPVSDLVMRPEEEGPGEACMSAESRDSLLRLIATIERPTWEEFGGPGTIHYEPTGQLLVVRQQRGVLEQVQELLDAVRRASWEDRCRLLPYLPRKQRELEEANAEFLKTWPGIGFFH